MSPRPLRASTTAQRKNALSSSPREPGEKSSKSQKKRPATKSGRVEKTTAETKSQKTSNSAQKTNPSTSNGITIEEVTGDLFDAPPWTLLIHACNGEASWGAGIAAAFRKKYPHAFSLYVNFCDEHGQDTLGKAQLIAPPDSPPRAAGEVVGAKRHFVGCLFTSRSKGRKKDSPDRILEATGAAMRDLIAQVDGFNATVRKEKKGYEGIGEVRMCKINSGLFAVPWEKTRGVLEEIEVGETSVMKNIVVVERAS